MKLKISVSKKILADIGRGIYRTPANALKEVVNNAFDACATWVKITTNAPYFDVFTCEDNGDGIATDKLKDIFSRIGSSTKRSKGQETIECEENNITRPIIGKIGIGILAVSQICDRFAIISKKKGEKTYFKATIDLLQFEKEDAYLNGKDEITLGEGDLKEIEAPKEEISKSFTRIVMESLKPGFRQKLTNEYDKQIVRIKDTSSTINDFFEFSEMLKSKKDFKSLSSYDYMLWELGMLCPVKYVINKETIFPNTKFLAKDIDRLTKYKFDVFVDGLEIRKPIVFTKSDKIKNEDDDYKIYLLPKFNEMVEGEKLKFHGYIYTQRTKIIPTDLQGILIRIKDVAISSYDKTILKYPKEEGPRFGMISGEIFVENGLEGALNIDRNSFNETHPHYQRLRSEIHQFIKNIVKELKLRSKQRRKFQKEGQAREELSKLTGKIKELWKIDISFMIEEMESKEPYSISKERIVFYTKNKGWAKAANIKLLQMKAITIVTLSQYYPKRISVSELLETILFSK